MTDTNLQAGIQATNAAFLAAVTRGDDRRLYRQRCGAADGQ